MGNLTLQNPKRMTEKEHRAEWYSYYAGFSHAFVRDVLRTLTIKKNAVLLDPWNGAGTTTLAGALEGLEGIGIDLNPAMNVIARGKLATKNEINTALSIVSNLRINALPKFKLNEDDYLLNWFSVDTSYYIRYVSCFILKRTISVSESRIHSVIFLAIFNVVRELVSKFIPSNPTWVKKAKVDTDKVHTSNKEVKEKIIAYLNDKLSKTTESQLEDKISLYCASSTDIPLPDSSVDIIITSPPYCTRIDYGIATSPELAVLIGDNPSKIDSIRRSLMGRTTIDKSQSIGLSYGKTANKILNEIEKHNSHASSTYYYKNYIQYFSEILKSINEIGRILKKNGLFVCVVQDSFYKEIYCDLAKAIIEMSNNVKLELISRRDFDARVVMANIHAGAKKYRSKINAKESVLMFKSTK